MKQMLLSVLALILITTSWADEDPSPCPSSLSVPRFSVWVTPMANEMLNVDAIWRDDEGNQWDIMSLWQVNPSVLKVRSSVLNFVRKELAHAALVRVDDASFQLECVYLTPNGHKVSAYRVAPLS